jgi:hypothetical protein
VLRKFSDEVLFSRTKGQIIIIACVRTQHSALSTQHSALST